MASTMTGLTELQEQGLLGVSLATFLTLTYYRGGKALAWLVTNHRW